MGLCVAGYGKMQGFCGIGSGSHKNAIAIQKASLRLRCGMRIRSIQTRAICLMTVEIEVIEPDLMKRRYIRPIWEFPR